MSKLPDTTRSLRLGIALEGLGWHPAAWQRSSVSGGAATVFGAPFWVELGRLADAGGIDFLTVEDGLGLQTERFDTPDRRGDQVRGRLDSIVTATLLLSSTSRIEVVVSRNVTHARPFQVAAQLASLAAIAPGRVAWRPQVSASAADARVVGGEPTPSLAELTGYVPTHIARRLHPLFDDAEDFLEAIRQLWASWPGDSIGAGPTGDDDTRPFVDRDQVGRNEISAGRFRAAGPLNVPVFTTPPVAVLAHHAIEPYRLAAAAADRVFVTPTIDTPLAEILGALRQLEALTPDARHPEVYLDVVVILADTVAAAERRQRDLDAILGYRWTSDAYLFAGTADGLAELIASWDPAGEATGLRLRPAVIPEDVERIVRDVPAALRRVSGAAG